MSRTSSKVGKYEIIEKIAKGGMGAVYKAKHPTLNRYVILKQLALRGGSGFIERFKREASLMIDFREEHIVQVYDHFKEGSSYYIAMEYIDGKSLDELIQERRYLSNEAVLLIFNEVCKGLKYAHDKNVIHRDIKPGNILISREGAVKLVDFGIATSKEEDDEGLTKEGMTLGTPSYMSPEQIADTKRVDKRADIYSMGVTFYEMLTGTRPFPGGFTIEAINAINRGIYTNPKKINPSMPHMFRRIIRKTMNHKIQKRYKDLQYIIDKFSKYTKKYKGQREINNDIKKYLSGSDIVFPSSIKIGRKRKQRKRAAWAFFSSIVLIVLMLLAGTYAVYKGYHYEYLRDKQYGSMEIVASIPRNYYKQPELIYAQARLTSLDTQNEDERTVYYYRLIPPKREFLSFLKKAKDEDGEKRNILTSKKVYLPAGNYVLELYLENYKYYQSFYLNPRFIQKQSKQTYAKRIMEFSLKTSARKQISIIHRISDSETGRSLYSRTDILFYLQSRKKWIDWKRYNSTQNLRDYLESHIKSGQTYSFKYSADSYYQKFTRFYVERDMDVAFIEVSLVKKPGKLVVVSDAEGLELLIDNRKEDYIGEQRKEFVKYGKTISGAKEYMLREGSYVLTVKKDKKHLQNHQFSITADRTTRLKVSYDTKKKKITISR